MCLAQYGQQSSSSQWFAHKIYGKTKDIIISIPQDTQIPF